MSEERPLILIADDDPDLRQLVRLNVETMDCDIQEASDGAQALEDILVDRPTLVVLDVMMPQLTGWEVLRYIRTSQDEDLRKTGVIMLTGIGETLNELSSPMYGADDYLDKPFRNPDLIAKVQSVLSKVRSRRENS